MTGHLEPVISIARIGGAYGEPFTWSAMIRFISPTHVQLDAILRAPTVTEYRALRRLLREAGVSTMTYCRKREHAATRQYRNGSL